TMTFVAPNLACGEARGGSIPRSGAVTDEQRSHRPNWAQPFGRQVLFAQTSLLAPYRPTLGMLVARASSGQKIPCRERHRIYVHDHLASQQSETLEDLQAGRGRLMQDGFPATPDARLDILRAIVEVQDIRAAKPRLLLHHFVKL